MIGRSRKVGLGGVRRWGLLGGELGGVHWRDLAALHRGLVRRIVARRAVVQHVGRVEALEHLGLGQHLELHDHLEEVERVLVAERPVELRLERVEDEIDLVEDEHAVVHQLHEPRAEPRLVAHAVKPGPPREA